MHSEPHSLIPISCCPHPFSGSRIELQLPEGLSLSQILEIAQPDPLLREYTVILLGDMVVPRVSWPRVRPKAGALVSLNVLPRGGGAGRTLAMIGVAVLAIVVSVASYGALTGPAIGLSATAAGAIAGAAGAAASLAGSLLVNTLLPPPAAELSRDYGRDQPAYAITGARNRADPWGKVPFLLGRFRLTPPYAAMPYREIVGGQIYWRVLFALSHGPIAIEEMSIGETPLANFTGVETEFRRGYGQLTDRGSWDPTSGTYPPDPSFGDTWTASGSGSIDGVRYRAGETITFNGLADPSLADAWDRDQGRPFTLFPNDVHEEGLSAAVQAAAPVVRTTQAAADEVGIELLFERGIVHIQNDPPGKPKARTQTVRIEQSPAGEDSWALVVEKGITGQQTTPLYWGHSWKTDAYGNADAQRRYDIRVTNVTGDQDEQRNFGNFAWIALRTITHGSPVAVPCVAKLALRIKASGQLSGVIDAFNVVARTIARDWDAVTGQWVWRPTSSPAALFRHVLQHPARERPATDAQIDLARLAEWDDLTRPAGRDFNGVIEAKTSLWDVLTRIARVGRAVPGLRDLLFSVIIDAPRSVPVRLFTPRNSWDYEGELTHAPIPHGYRIGFVDAASGWRTDDELVVYDDGYDADTATRINRVEWIGLTRREQAWTEGRYHLAQQRLRREVHRISCDIEHLACERGDLVALQHDVIAVGLGSARITTLTVDGNNDGARALSVTLDAPMPMQDGTDYGIRVRRVVLGAQRTDLYAVTTVAGEHATLAFVDPPLLADAPSVGDLVAFGELGRESLRVLVRDIEPRADLSARLTLIAEAPGVHLAEQGPIPAYDPVVTRPATLSAPQVLDIRSDETVMLVTASRALVERVVFSLQPIGIDATRTLVLVRPSGTDGQWQAASIQEETAGSVALIGLASGLSYDFILQRTHPDYPASLPTQVSGYQVVGRSSPPAGLQNLSLAIVGSQALLRWDLAPDLDVQVGGWIGFRHTPELSGASWPNSTSLARTVNGDQTHVFMPLKEGTYLARVHDSGGRASEQVASVSTRQASVLAFSPVATLIEHPDFPGSRENCAVVDGGLQLLEVGSFDAVPDVDSLADWDTAGSSVAPAGTYHFSAGIDLGAVRSVRLTSRLKLAAVNPYDSIDARTTDIDAWPDIDGVTGASVDASIWGRLTDDDPAGDPVWGPPVRIDANEITARAVGELQCRLVTADSTYGPRITELALIAEEVA